MQKYFTTYDIELIKKFQNDNNVKFPIVFIEYLTKISKYIYILKKI